MYVYIEIYIKNNILILNMVCIFNLHMQKTISNLFSVFWLKKASSMWISGASWQDGPRTSTGLFSLSRLTQKKLSNWIISPSVTVKITPPKTNMEPEAWAPGRGDSYEKTIIFRFHDDVCENDLDPPTYIQAEFW